MKSASGVFFGVAQVVGEFALAERPLTKCSASPSPSRRRGSSCKRLRSLRSRLVAPPPRSDAPGWGRWQSSVAQCEGPLRADTEPTRLREKVRNPAGSGRSQVRLVGPVSAPKAVAHHCCGPRPNLNPELRRSPRTASSIEPDLTTIHGDHQHFQDRPAIGSSRIGATPGWQKNAVRPQIFGGRLRRCETVCNVHA